MIVISVVLGAVLMPLNSTMIAVALPEITDDLGVTVSRSAWLVTSYLVALASLLPLAGDLADRFGRRRMILSGLTVFGIASFGAAVAPNFETLLVFRVLQAISGAMVLPAGWAVLREVIPEQRRAYAFGLMGSMIGLAAGGGPPLGGLLTELAGWRAIFYANVPVVAAAMILGWRVLPRTGVLSEARSSGRFDFGGALLLPIVLSGMAGVLMAIARGAPWLIVGVATAAVVGGAVLLALIETRVSSPVLQPRLFRIRAFTAAAGGVAFSNMSMYVVLLGVPLMLTARGGYSNLEIGLVLTALSIASFVVSPVAGRFADRLGRRTPTVFGLTITTVAAVPLAIEGSDISVQLLVGALILFGIGFGVANPGMQTGALEAAPLDRAAAASGVYSTSRYFGSIVGSAILAGLIGTDRADASGIDGVFIMVLVASGIALVSVMGLASRRPGEATDASPTAESTVVAGN
ncbi:MAG: MFS transporter [Chloroflexi bacterium]|nr:MFS transporter [Chloroflexota bacterium]